MYYVNYEGLNMECKKCNPLIQPFPVLQCSEVNYSRHSESVKNRKNSEIDDMFLR